MIPAVEHRCPLPAPPAQAFGHFTRDFGRWWPRAYSWSGEQLVDIGLQCRADGLCYEIGPHGFHLDWGRVLRWRPPTELLISWQISQQRVPQPDPAQASEVHVLFAEGSGAGCELQLQHRLFERHGPGAEDYRAAMASEHGWPYILAGFSRWLADSAGEAQQG